MTDWSASTDRVGDAGDASPLLSVLRTFRSGVVVATTDGARLVSTPVALADSSRDGRIWLLARPGAERLNALLTRPVTVTLQAGEKYLAIAGSLRHVVSEAKLDEIWTESFRAWFPRGKQDLDLVLLQLRARQIEFWETGSLHPVRSWMNAARALLTPEEEAPETVDYGRITLA
jgi:general stress protein 26